MAIKTKQMLKRVRLSLKHDVPLSMKGVPFIENGSEVVVVVEAVECDVDVIVVLVIVSAVSVVETVLVVLEGVRTELEADGGAA